MTPMKLDVLIASFCYAGNGGVATVLPEIAFWLPKVVSEMQADERIGRVACRRYGDIPLTMERNKVVADAIEGGYDAILMLDSDNIPDLYVGVKDWAKPFWKTSFDFLYERSCRSVPTVICSPYCGPPPNPRTGGAENVYVFYVDDHETDRMEAGFQIKSYDRAIASKMRGIQEIAAGPTGVILYSTDAFSLMPIGDPYRTDGEVLDAYAKGEIDKQRALRMIAMKSWFFYEFTDRYQTQKASTEDVTNTREIQLAGYQKCGESVVFCNWDAWAGHMKPKCVGMPEPINMEQINSTYAEAVKRDLHVDEQIKNIDFTAGLDLEESVDLEEDWPSGEGDTDYDDTPTMSENLSLDVPVIPRMVNSRRINCIGSRIEDCDLKAVVSLTSWVAASLGEGSARVIEVGAWVGETTTSLVAGCGLIGQSHVYTLNCDSVWYNKSQSEFVDRLGDDVIIEQFKRNLEDLIDRNIVRPLAKFNVSSTSPQDATLIFIDSGPTEEVVGQVLCDWYRHVAPDGVLAGMNYSEESPHVMKAVEDFCATAGEIPEVIEGSSVWYVQKQKLVAGFLRNKERESSATKETDRNAE